MLEWAIVHQMSRAELARRLSIHPPSVPALVADLVRDLANAYDQKLRSA